MAFVRHGSPEKIETLDVTSANAVVCKKCGNVLIRSTGDAKISFSGFGTMITCKCGEVAHV